MRNKIIATLIISLLLTQTNFSAIVNGGGDYKRKANEEWVQKKEALDYFDGLQKWLDRDSNVELLRKVASRSELKGYVSENTIDWEHLYDDTINRKATKSNATRSNATH